MVPAAFVGRHDRRAARRCSRPATRSSTAATRTTTTTSRARSGSRRSGLHYVDMGTSGGVWGLERGYCLMIGGEPEVVAAARPDLRDPRPRAGRHPAHARPRGAERHGRARLPALRPERRRPLREDGPQRHRVRPDGRVRRGPEHPEATRTSARRRPRADAETTPLRHPEHYQYDFDLADITEVWRRGSVVASWLLDLTAQALAGDRELDDFGGPRLRLRRGALDAGRRQRRGGAGARADRRAVRALRLARRGRLSRTACCRRCASGSAATSEKK